jgi:hypothetical protein
MKKVFLILSIVVLTIVFAGLGCKSSSRNQTNEAATSPLFSNDPASFDEEFNQLKNTADEKALAWKSDAKLIYISTKIPLSLDPAFVQHTFVYDSVTDFYNHWTIAIETGNKSSIRALIPRADYLGSSPQQILSSYWKINFVKALQVCEGAGGEDFRSKNTSNYQIELKLFRTASDPLRWHCQYSTLNESKSKEIIVDAMSGEIAKD